MYKKIPTWVSKGLYSDSEANPARGWLVRWLDAYVRNLSNWKVPWQFWSFSWSIYARLFVIDFLLILADSSFLTYRLGILQALLAKPIQGFEQKCAIVILVRMRAKAEH